MSVKYPPVRGACQIKESGNGEPSSSFLFSNAIGCRFALFVKFNKDNPSMSDLDTYGVSNDPHLLRILRVRTGTVGLPS